jgi:drug/metabolite transporter (DMT)-like permease
MTRQLQAISVPLAALVLLLAMGLSAMIYGEIGVSDSGLRWAGPSELWAWLTESSLEAKIFWRLRLPRIVGAALVGAGLAGAASMAAGTVLSRRWQPPVSLLTFTAWQLVAGGMLLLPAAMWLEPPLPSLSQSNLFGFMYLGLVGAALTYVLWFRGIARLEPSLVSTLGFLSPLTAVAIGWWVLDQGLGSWQLLGVCIVFMSVWLSQYASTNNTRTKPIKGLLTTQFFDK